MRDSPLQATRVLDLTRWLPGPYASLALADLGAEVIKVEEPRRGDPMRHLLSSNVDDRNVLFDLLNRNKKSVTLNLKAPEGKAILLGLARDTDVLLEGFRPSVMKRLGLEYEALASVSPGLVYASISGYGQTGPFRSRAGHDQGYLAVAGLLGLTGSQDGPPVVPGVPVADLFAALWTALGVMAALLERQRTGRGRYLDISLLDGVTALLPLPLAEWWTAGRVPQRGKMLLSGKQACYSIYETADGGYMTLAALELHFWQVFCVAVRRKDWLPRQHDADQRSLIGEVAALFRTRPREHWAELFAEHDCCCEPVLALDEAFAHPQVVHRGLLREGYLATPLRRAGVPLAPAPQLGQHTAEVLGGLGYTMEDVERLRQQGVV